MSQLVSIVISHWNRVNDLQDAVQSIMAQDYSNLELVIVDNCSSESDQQYIRSLPDKLNIPVIIKIMPNSNYTAMETINLGFKLTNGSLIFIMDDDSVILTPTCITQLVEIYNSHSCVGAISTNVIYKDGSHQMPIRMEDGREITDFELLNLYSDTFDYFEFHGAGTLFDKSAISKCGYYDENFVIYYNEIDLSFKLIKHGYKILYAKNIHVLHKQSMIGRNVGKRSYYAIRNMCIVFDRNFRFVPRVITSFVWCWRHISTLRSTDRVYLYPAIKISIICLAKCFKPRPVTKKSCMIQYAERCFFSWAKYRIFNAFYYKVFNHDIR